MLDDHKEHIDEIAHAAAALHGQEWTSLPHWTRDRWKETVRNTARGSAGVNEMERCAGQAIDEWYKRREAPPIVEAVEAEEAPPKQKPRKK